MSSYSELIKNFEKIRAYMREFYIYGFKSREEYDRKSARSYDNEKRRMESWLGDYMRFIRTPEGKNIFLSIDSRVTRHNPFYKAWKAKSFTVGDITLHFILFDILYAPQIQLSLPEIMQKLDEEYLTYFENPMLFDESTVRKKLKEYETEGIIISQKQGRKMLYRRGEEVTLPELSDVLDFFSETAPCGVIGSFLLDKFDASESRFAFKHHYLMSTLDSDILALLFTAMRQKREVTLWNLRRHEKEPHRLTLVPLRIFISVQNGRQHLLAYLPSDDKIKSFRMDHLSDVSIGKECPQFGELRARLNAMQPHIWGVNCSEKKKTEHIEFTLHVNPDETYIINRLNREKRIGTVEQLDPVSYRFSADVYDSCELFPWIRTFFCRITALHFSNKKAEKQFKDDLKAMYQIYGIEEDRKI